MPLLRRWSALAALAGLQFALLHGQTPDAARVLDAKSHHLGVTEINDWPETTAQPEGRQLQLRFEAQANAGEVVVGIVQRDVSAPWQLQINGKRVAELRRNEKPKLVHYAIPAGTLVAGENTLTIESKDGKDDIAVGPITLHNQSLREVLRLRSVLVSVTDARSGQPVPARVTVTDLAGNRVELHRSKMTDDSAMREGLIYLRGTPTWFELPEGDYVVYATRGLEWSRGEQRLLVRGNAAAEARLRIEREVRTTGFIAADTHLHTVTFSGHGDASIEERMLTLAGEGVELAVATDHNHNTDYLPHQQQMGVGGYFTAVTGNEVTTAIGHMNGFPLDPKATPPDHKLGSWVQLVDAIRAKGAKVVILNHPRWPSLPKSPFTQFGLNRVSGDFRADVKFPFDGMELANALTPQPDPLYLFRDWFALLNSGEKITGVGASDSHTVGEPVGQSRSYVPSRTDDPAKIDVDDACNRFLRGETSISLGIFADVLVDGRYKMGHTNSVRGATVSVRLRVAAPSWVTPRRALLFLNGQQVQERAVLAGAPRKPTDVLMDFVVQKPAHDAYLVCVVLGDGASHPSWQTAEKFTLAATNPVFLDTDGDGQYSSPRDLALAALQRAGISTDHQWEAIATTDDVVAVQMLSLMRQYWPQSEQEELQKRIQEASARRPIFREFLDYPQPPIRVSASQLK